MQKKIAPVLTACALALSGTTMLECRRRARAEQVLARRDSAAHSAVPLRRCCIPAKHGAQRRKLRRLGRYYLEATPVAGAEQPSTRADRVGRKSRTARTSDGVQEPPTRDQRRRRPPAMLLNTVTPLCTVLSINTSYSLSGTATGGSYCYGFQVTQRAKTQVFLTGQNANTNFALTLIRHNDDDTLTVLGTSDQAGNANESLLTLTQPGLYYWLMDANASDGSSIQLRRDRQHECRRARAERHGRSRDYDSRQPHRHVGETWIARRTSTTSSSCLRTVRACC